MEVCFYIVSEVYFHIWSWKPSRFFAIFDIWS